MKKYIISLMTLSCVMFHANAMELILKSGNLGESLEQFLARTRHIPPLTPECKSFFENRNMQCERYSFSPYQTKLLAVTKENSNGLMPYYLMMMKLHKEHGVIKPDLIFQTPLNFANDVPEYNRVALASDGSMIATFYENITWRKGERDGEVDRCSVYVFRVKKIDMVTGEIINQQRIEFPGHFYPTIIAFNEQGTLLIARDEEEYQLFDVRC